MTKLRCSIIAVFLAVAATRSFAKQPLEEIIRADYPVPANVALMLRLADGTVHVYGSDQNVIKLTAIKKAYTKERLDQIKVDVAISGEEATIETKFPPKPEGLSIADRSGTVDYILLVPQTGAIAQIEVETGEVIVEGLRGSSVNVRLTNGRILARNCYATTNLELVRGGIDVGYSWWEEDRVFKVSAQSASGDLRVALPRNAAASFDATTGDGWVRNQFIKDEPNDSRTMQWAMGENPATSITLRAQSGNIRIENIY